MSTTMEMPVKAKLDSFFGKAQDHETVSLTPLRKCFIVTGASRIRFLRNVFQGSMKLDPERNGVRGMTGTVSYNEGSQTLSYQNENLSEPLTCEL